MPMPNNVNVLAIPEIGNSLSNPLITPNIANPQMMKTIEYVTIFLNDVYYLQ